VAAVPPPAAELAESDHADEDEADDQHRDDDLLALLGSCLRGERQEHAVTLLHAPPVGRERALDVIRRRLAPFAQLRGGLGPSFAVTWEPVRSELCAK
jgi:hypothetical protein